MRNISFQWVVWLRVLEQGDDAFNYEFGVQSGHPVVFNSLCADFASILLDIWVVDLGLEEDLEGG